MASGDQVTAWGVPYSLLETHTAWPKTRIYSARAFVVLVPGAEGIERHAGRLATRYRHWKHTGLRRAERHLPLPMARTATAPRVRAAPPSIDRDPGGGGPRPHRTKGRNGCYSRLCSVRSFGEDGRGRQPDLHLRHARRRLPHCRARGAGRCGASANVGLAERSIGS